MQTHLYHSGAEYILDQAFSKTGATAVCCVLYTDPLGKLTQDELLTECTHPSYSRVALDEHDCATIGMADKDGIPQTVWPNINFIFTGKINRIPIQGYAICKWTAELPLVITDVIFADNFKSPYIPTDGGAIWIEVKLKYSAGETS